MQEVLSGNKNAGKGPGRLPEIEFFACSAYPVGYGSCMPVRISLILLISALLIWQCGPSQRTPEEYKIVSQQIFEQVQKDLLSELLPYMKKNDAAGGIAACQVRSTEIEAKYSKDHLRIRRVSDKVRNPAHAPDEIEAAILKQWHTEMQSGKQPAPVVQTEVDRTYVLKPILITSGTCLKCHGVQEQLSPEVQTILKEKYPYDQATGYEMNQLRGAFSAVWMH